MTSMRIRLGAFAAALVCLSWSTATATAQLAPSPDAPPVSHAPPPSEDERAITTLKLGVNLVDLYFTVKDKNGELVPHLTKNDCKVEEDKTPQTLKNFVAETNQALTLGIMLDTSGSQQRVLPLEQAAGSQFLQRVLRSKDEAFLISFDVNVDLLQDYTNSAHLLSRALDKAEINTAGGNGSAGIPGAGGGTIPSIGAPKGTLFYDAIKLAAEQKLNQETGRKAMIILTDGEDQGSRLRVKDAIEAAQKSDSIVYVILIADRGFYGMGGYSGDSEMKKLSGETGGRVIEVGNKFDKLKEAFDQIARELRSQYNLGYTPTNRAKDGTFRKVEIHAKGKDYKIQARSGYYAVAPKD